MSSSSRDVYVDQLVAAALSPETVAGFSFSFVNLILQKMH